MLECLRLRAVDTQSITGITHIHTNRQFIESNSPMLHVFGLWGKLTPTWGEHALRKASCCETTVLPTEPL